LANCNLDDAAIANGLSDQIEQVVKQTTRKRKRSHRLSKSAAFCDLVPERLIQKTLTFVSEVSFKSQDRSGKQKYKKPIPKHDYLNDRNEVERHPFNPPVRAITSTPAEPHPCSTFPSPAGSTISIVYDEVLAAEYGIDGVSWSWRLRHVSSSVIRGQVEIQPHFSRFPRRDDIHAAGLSVLQLHPDFESS
jgi:hypothetical protein